MFFCHPSFKMLLLGVAYMHYGIYWFLHNLQINGKFPLKIIYPFFSGCLAVHSLYYVFSTHCYYKLQNELLSCKCKKILFPMNMLQLKGCNVNSYKKTARVNLAGFLAKHTILINGNYSIIDFKCWSWSFWSVSLPLITKSVKWILQRLFPCLLPSLSFFAAMVQQLHESHLCVAGW